MMASDAQPKRTRPDIPIEYGVPSHEEGMIEWQWVVDKLKQARNYWLVSTYPDGRPHSVPSWGAWMANRLYFGGGDMTRHAKNLAVNPAMIAHLESGDEVVIIYGTAAKAEATADQMAQIAADYTSKYNMPEQPNYMLIPHKILAWTGFPQTPTRFTFE